MLRVPCGPAIPRLAGRRPRARHAAARRLLPAAGRRFWLDEPATLVLRFRGGAKPQKVSFSGGARVDDDQARRDDHAALPGPRRLEQLRGAARLAAGGPDYPGADAAPKIVEKDGSSPSSCTEWLACCERSCNPARSSPDTASRASPGAAGWASSTARSSSTSTGRSR